MKARQRHSRVRALNVRAQRGIAEAAAVIAPAIIRLMEDRDCHAQRATCTNIAGGVAAWHSALRQRRGQQPPARLAPMPPALKLTTTTIITVITTVIVMALDGCPPVRTHDAQAANVAAVHGEDALQSDSAVVVVARRVQRV